MRLASFLDPLGGDWYASSGGGGFLRMNDSVFAHRGLDAGNAGG
jgi:hypothetical protein